MTDTFRSKMAALPFSEKIKILEQMLERERLIAPVRERLRAEIRKQQNGAATGSNAVRHD